MKRLFNLKNLFVIATASFSTLAFAGGFQWTMDEKKIEGQLVGSKAAAYEEGIDMINSFQNMSSRQLSKVLTDYTHRADKNSIMITDTTVYVDEFLQSNGQVVYQPIMNVSYTYRTRLSTQQ